MGKWRVGIDVVENAGPNTMASFLRNAVNGASGLDIASAFVTASGLALVARALRKVAVGGRVRVLTGLYQGFTEPDALRSLLHEEREAEGRLSVRVSRDRHFHRKAYFVMRRKTASVAVGSSNLTGDGLQQSGELNVVLSLSRESAEFRRLHRTFEAEWDEAIPVNETMLERYGQWRAGAGVSGKRVSVPIAAILGAPKTARSVPTEDTARSAPRHWRTCIDGTLAPETVLALEEATDWDRKGYWYFSTWRTVYARGDHVVLFDLTGKTVQVVEIVATTRTPSTTPDGRHFAAYRKVAGIPSRQLVRPRWESLKAAGLIRRRTDAQLSGRISEAKFGRFVDNLNSRADR